MTRVRIIYRPDKCVSIMHLVEKARHKDETDEQMFTRCQNKISLLKGLPYDDVDQSTLPIRDTNRDKWRGEKGKGIFVDLTVKTKVELLLEEYNKLPTELKLLTPIKNMYGIK